MPEAFKVRTKDGGEVTAGVSAFVEDGVALITTRGNTHLTRREALGLISAILRVIDPFGEDEVTTL